jgi:hypothetical protein
VTGIGFEVGLKNLPERFESDMSMNEHVRLTKAFNLSVAAGVLILLNAVLLGAASTWFPWVIPTLPGSADNSEVPFASLTVVGLICGVLVLLGGMMLRGNPVKRKAWGIVIIVFSLPSVIMGGGFIIGFILGIVGGFSALSRESEMQAIQSAKQERKFTAA